MTRLRPDYRGFETDHPPAGLSSAEQVAFQLVGPKAQQYAEEIRAAVAAVVYFFRNDLGRSTVSLADFAATLDKALAGLGLSLELPLRQAELGLETDLASLLAWAPESREGAGFAPLRRHLREQLRVRPAVIRYCGLRDCVRRALGVPRWTPRCQRLADQIVGFLRACLQADGRGSRCILVVR